MTLKAEKPLEKRWVPKNHPGLGAEKLLREDLSSDRKLLSLHLIHEMEMRDCRNHAFNKGCTDQSVADHKHQIITLNTWSNYRLTFLLI